jgi:hypothetical protein
MWINLSVRSSQTLDPINFSDLDLTQIGTGFATTDAAGYAADETQLAADFIGFLSNLIKVRA